MSKFANDPRYAPCSNQGRVELEIYLQWIKDVGIEDTEYAYVSYVMGRASIKDARHLFAIWEQHIGRNIERDTRSQVRRFFMNPSSDTGFNLAGYAGWFEFIPIVYQLTQAVPAPKVNMPIFVKVGSDDLPLKVVTDFNLAQTKFYNKGAIESIGQTKGYFPKVSVYDPGNSTYESVNDEASLYKILFRNKIKPEKNWHILISGDKSAPKSIIRDLILKDKIFNNIRHTSGNLIQNPKDIAAILTSLEDESNLLEIDDLDALLETEWDAEEIICTAIRDFEIEICVGEGANVRSIKLDLAPFSSIIYCQDVDVLPINLIKCFNLIINLK